jgi:hypothetical protein
MVVFDLASSFYYFRSLRNAPQRSAHGSQLLLRVASASLGYRMALQIFTSWINGRIWFGFQFFYLRSFRNAPHMAHSCSLGLHLHLWATTMALQNFWPSFWRRKGTYLPCNLGEASATLRGTCLQRFLFKNIVVVILSGNRPLSYALLDHLPHLLATITIDTAVFPLNNTAYSVGPE